MTAAAEFFSALPERLSTAGDGMASAVIAFALEGAPTAAGRCGWVPTVPRSSPEWRRPTSP